MSELSPAPSNFNHHPLRKLPPGTTRPFSEKDHEMVKRNLQAAKDIKQHQSAERHFHVSLDGTWQDESKTSSVDDLRGNIAIINSLINNQNKDNLASSYIPGVGTKGPVSKYIAGSLLPTEECKSQADNGYAELVRQSNLWAQENPDFKLTISAAGFSRGGVSFLFFADKVEKEGIPDTTSEYLVEVPGPADGTWITQKHYTKYIVPPGEAQITGILLDPVPTGIAGIPALPDAVKRLHAIYANDEFRKMFRALLLKHPDLVDSRITNWVMPGCHSDINGGLDKNGASSAVLELLSTLLSKEGISLAAIPESHRYIPELASVHDSAVGPFLYDWEPFRKWLLHYLKSPGEANTASFNPEETINGSRVETAISTEATNNDKPLENEKLPDIIDASENTENTEVEDLSVELDPEADLSAIRNAQAAMNAFNTFVSSVENWANMSDLQRIAAATNFYNGIATISGGALPLPGATVTGASLLNLGTAIEAGQYASALASALQVVDTLTQSAHAAGIVSSNLGSSFLPTLNLALAARSGNALATASSALSLYAANNPAAMAWAGPVGVFGSILGMAIAKQPPTVAGWSHAGVDMDGLLAAEIAHDRDGGGHISHDVMTQMLNAFEAELHKVKDDDDRAHFALNPARLPKVGYWHDPTGPQYQDKGASMLLRWQDAHGQTVTRFYDGNGQRADGSGENIAQDFAYYAQQAIVPSWLLEGALPKHRELMQSAAELDRQAQSLQLEADTIAPRITHDLQGDLGPVMTPSPAPQRHKALLPQISSLREQAALQRQRAHDVLAAIPLMSELGQKPVIEGENTQSIEALTLPVGEPVPALEGAEPLRQVLMDLDGDGFLELTNWVRSNQAMLGIDLNADGRLDGPELLSSDLRWLDSNGDGRLDAKDPAFRAIRVWLDANGDGQTQHATQGADGQARAPSELKRLHEVGIQSIEYGGNKVTVKDSQGASKPVEKTQISGDRLGVRYRPGDKNSPGVIRTDERLDGNHKDTQLPINTGKPAKPQLSTPPKPKDPVKPHVNRNPVATDDVFNGSEDIPMEIAFQQLLANDWDPDTPVTHDVLSVTGVSHAVHGTAAMGRGFVRFVPDKDFYGQARFTYTISDGKGGQASARALLNFAAVNDPPIIDEVTYDTAPNRWAMTFWDGDLYHFKDPALASGRVIAHDIDTPGPLSYRIRTAPIHGHASIDGSGAWNYRAERIDPYEGADPFTVEVSDAEGASSVATVHTRHEKDRKVREIDKKPIGWSPPVREPDHNYFAPVVIDLQRDGYQLLSADDASVCIDVHDRGIRQQIGWVGPSDALLALDRDGDGRITRADELSFVNDWPGAQSDLEGLRAFDTNGDGWLTADDERWQDFGLFQDLNSDGKQDKGEFTPLPLTAIAGIELEHNGQLALINGNLVLGSAQVQWADGSIGMAGDVMLEIQPGFSRACNTPTGGASLDQQVDQLISAMAGFAPAAADSSVCPVPAHPMSQPMSLLAANTL